MLFGLLQHRFRLRNPTVSLPFERPASQEILEVKLESAAAFTLEQMLLRVGRASPDPLSGALVDLTEPASAFVGQAMQMKLSGGRPRAGNSMMFARLLPASVPNKLGWI